MHALAVAPACRCSVTSCSTFDTLMLCTQGSESLFCVQQMTMGIRSVRAVLIVLLGMCARLVAASKHPARPPPATIATEVPVTAGSEKPEGKEYIAIDGLAFFESKHTFPCAASRCQGLPRGHIACSSAALLPFTLRGCHFAADI